MKKRGDNNLMNDMDILGLLFGPTNNKKTEDFPPWNSLPLALIK